MISLPPSLSPHDHNTAKAIVKYAYHNIYTIDDQLDIKNGNFNDYRDKKQQALDIPGGLRLRFTIEENLNVGLIQCLEVFNLSGIELVNPESLLTIARQSFGFDASRDFEFDKPKFLDYGVTQLTLWQVALL